MMLTETYGRRPAGPFVYAAALAAVALGMLLRSPVVAIDNDLWYHLSHGRYLFEQGEIADTSYFSFLEPQRHWVNYYWLFQVVAYAVFTLAGYVGLLVLRTALFAAYLWVVGRLLLRRAGSAGVPPAPREAGAERLWWSAFVFGLYLTHAFHKYEMVRPHTWSYLLVAVFLYVLELHPGKAWLLPLLALLWTNLHGVEYPVLLLIALAYLAEMVVGRLRRGGAARPGETRLALWLSLAMAAVFLTPHGTDLVRVPFTSTRYASSYIEELAQLPLAEFFAYSFSGSGFAPMTVSNLLLLIALLAAVGHLARGTARLRHLLLLAGGLVLLSKAIRFNQELALLALPLIASYRWPLPRRRRGSIGAAALLLAALLLATPWLFLAQRLPSRLEHYPLALRNLPHGIAAFLHQADARGAVMNNPNVGGYLQWALGPRYRIFMDLEIPFLFADEDIYFVASAFAEPEPLRRFLARYDPPFIAAPLAPPGFGRRIARHPEYTLVFFDDTGPLYVDRERYPELAERFEIRHVDPYALGGVRFSALGPGQRRRYSRELERIAAIDPDIASVNQALAILHNLAGRPDAALARIDAVLAKQPRLPRGHAIRGDVLKAQGRLAAAEVAYRRALRCSDHATERRSVQRSLSVLYVEMERFEAAYAALREAVGAFNVEASYSDLYHLGVLAAQSGEPHDAVKMLEIALLKVPPEEAEWRRRIEESIAALAAGL